MTDEHTPVTPSTRGLPQPPTLDIEAYSEDLNGFELTDDEQREVLAYLWAMVKTIVDAGFGLDAASMALGAITRELFESAAGQQPKSERTQA